MNQLSSADDFWELWKNYRNLILQQPRNYASFKSDKKHEHVDQKLSQKEFSLLEDEILEILESLNKTFREYENPFLKTQNLKSCQSNELVLKINLYVNNTEFKWDVDKKLSFIKRLELYAEYLKNHIEYGNFINFPGAHELLINRNQIDYNFFEPPCLSNPLFWDFFFLNCITKEDYLSRLDILSSGSDNILEYFSRHNFYSLVWNHDLFYNHIGCLILSIEVLKTTINEFFNKLEIVTNRVKKINDFIGVFKSNNHKYFLSCKCTTKSKKVKTNIFLDIKEANNTAEDLDLYVYSCPYASEFTGIKNYQYHLTSNYRLV